ncbi:hypothetical protein U9M48_026399 [Paspalum notatum var. saurae]|uniref:Uncharacterized protein n=1 Tax=Paspalum notatum var. saurae TaxID=547442 RepID=A0AAQ3WYZ4_PASNO
MVFNRFLSHSFKEIMFRGIYWIRCWVKLSTEDDKVWRWPHQVQCRKESRVEPSSRTFNLNLVAARLGLGRFAARTTSKSNKGLIYFVIAGAARAHRLHFTEPTHRGRRRTPSPSRPPSPPPWRARSKRHAADCSVPPPGPSLGIIAFRPSGRDKPQR